MPANNLFMLCNECNKPRELQDGGGYIVSPSCRCIFLPQAPGMKTYRAEFVGRELGSDDDVGRISKILVCENIDEAHDKLKQWYEFRRFINVYEV